MARRYSIFSFSSPSPSSFFSPFPSFSLFPLRRFSRRLATASTSSRFNMKYIKKEDDDGRSVMGRFRYFYRADTVRTHVKRITVRSLLTYIPQTHRIISALKEHFITGIPARDLVPHSKNSTHATTMSAIHSSGCFRQQQLPVPFI